MHKKAGLTSEEVLLKNRQNRVNVWAKSYTRSYVRIFLDNIFSYFNIIMAAFFVLLVLTKNYNDTLFIGVVFTNLFTGVLQEFKMKRAVDRLSVIKESTVQVLRDGKWQQIPDRQIVEGEIIRVKPGDSLSVDGELIETEGVELDESMISGESEPVAKREGDEVFSGSCILSGTAVIKALRVGETSFSGKISMQAKKHRQVYSPLTQTIGKIIKVMSVIILPLSALLFCSQYFLHKIEFNRAVVSTAGAAIGMIPSGLVLLTTVTMALGVVRSAKKGALISQQKAVETLARIDTLCIDKTGTLTTGNIKLAEIFCVDRNVSKPDAKRILFSVINSFEEKNATARAVQRYFENESFSEAPYTATDKTPFSSQRKYCAVNFKEAGFFALGAPEFLVNSDDFYKSIMKQGGRVLALVKYKKNEITKESGKVIAYIKFEDEIRSDALKTVKQFSRSGVDIKIISGDSVEAIKSVAVKVGFCENIKSIDMSVLKGFDNEKVEKATEGAVIFGRCDPEQKRQLVQIFKNRGKIVAMTGDGVNDVPAMRNAHCAVAMSSGADAAKGAADVVIKDSFAPMTQVIMEGRRVINNMSRVSVLYLVKTLFSVILSVYFLFSGGKYPLQPVHLTLIGSVFTGMPSFFLAMEKNVSKIKKGYASDVIFGAVPGAVGISVSVAVLHILTFSKVVSLSDFSSLCVWIAGAVSAMVLLVSSMPINLYRGVIVILMTLMYIPAMIVLKPFIEVSYLSRQGVFILWTVILINAVFVFGFEYIKKIYTSKKQEKSSRKFKKI